MSTMAEQYQRQGQAAEEGSEGASGVNNLQEDFGQKSGLDLEDQHYCSS